MVRKTAQAAARIAAAALTAGHGLAALAQPAAAPPPASAATAAREVVLRSLCPRATDTGCTLTPVNADGSPGPGVKVANQTGLRALDVGNDLVEVQLNGKSYRIPRISVIVQKQLAPVGRAVDCDRVAGVRASGCDGR